MKKIILLIVLSIVDMSILCLDREYPKSADKNQHNIEKEDEDNNEQHASLTAFMQDENDEEENVRMRISMNMK